MFNKNKVSTIMITIFIVYVILQLIVVGFFLYKKYTYVVSLDRTVLTEVCVMDIDSNITINDVGKIIDIVGSVDVDHKRTNIDIAKDIRKELNKNLNTINGVWKPIQVTDDEIRICNNNSYEKRIVFTRTNNYKCKRL